MNEIKPSTTEIEKFLKQNLSDTIPDSEDMLKHIANIIASYSTVDEKQENILIEKDKLKFFLNTDIVNSLPNQFPVKVDELYYAKIAIEKVKEETVSAMDKLLEEINELSKNKLYNNNDIIECITNNNDIDAVLKHRIIDNLTEINEHFDKTLKTSTEKIYKDSLTEIFSPHFYKELLSDSIKMKRKDDVDLFKIFAKAVNKFNNKAVMFIDFTNFKALNEIVGHDEADKFLKNFADYLKDKNSVIPIRRSGDEFIVIGNEEELKNIQQEMISKEFIEKFNNYEKYPELEKTGILAIPVGGVEKLTVNLNNEITSLEQVNQIKSELTAIIKKAEDAEEELKKTVKQKFNQPLSRDEALNKISSDEDILLIKNNLFIYNRFIDEVNENEPEDEIEAMDWINTEPYSDEKFVEWIKENYSKENIIELIADVKEQISNPQNIVNNGGGRPKP